MVGFKQIFVYTTLLASSLVSAAPRQYHDDDSIVDWTSLSAMLDSLDENVLHNVLHNLSPKFRDGVFSKDRAAIEHVHSEAPLMATKLVYMAKRQSNSTVVVQSTSSSVAPSVSSSISSVSASVSSELQSALSSQITATTVPNPTTVLVAPAVSSNEVAVSTVPGGVVVSTQGGGVVTRTSSAVGVRFTPSTSTHYFYSTAADGTVSTSTSLVVVNAPVTETAVATGAAGAAQSSGGAGLQNAAERTSPETVFFGMMGVVFTAVLGLFVAM